MLTNEPAGRTRRSFIKDSLRFTAFGALMATGAALGLRKTSADSRIYSCTQTSRLSCRECVRFARCDVSPAGVRTPDKGWHEMPDSGGATRAEK